MSSSCCSICYEDLASSKCRVPAIEKSQELQTLAKNNTIQFPAEPLKPGEYCCYFCYTRFVSPATEMVANQYLGLKGLREIMAGPDSLEILEYHIQNFKRALAVEPMIKKLYDMLVKEEGEIEAQYLLGSSFRDGRGFVPQDDEMARYWFEKAAYQGHPKALFMLGIMYVAGFGGSIDNEQSIQFFSKAKERFEPLADQGNPEAQYYLGIIYKEGFGTEKNPSLALKLFKLSADQGFEEAISEIESSDGTAGQPGFGRG
jgi:hypothetical protein